jgi:hypothetical protein
LNEAPLVAADLSTRINEVFSGRRRVAPATTLLIASLVTVLVALPLMIRALDDDSAARLGEVAELERLTVTLGDDEPSPLDGGVVQGDALIVYDDPEVDAASFALFAVGADSPLLASQDLDGPTFSPVLDDSGADLPLDTTLLANGDHELFVVVTRGNVEQRTVATFEVRNP